VGAAGEDRHALALRAKIVLGLRDGATNKQAAVDCGADPATVSNGAAGRAAQRVAVGWLMSAAGRPLFRSCLGGNKVEEVITATLRSCRRATHWSRAIDGRAHGLSQVHDRADLAQVRPQPH